ncbi:MAG: TldD/PmbA family protein [Deltaproteobacteria bacterium]|nr:MAG: TldD/PmbA family protein [Deltaproteobacteria bacterium]
MPPGPGVRLRDDPGGGPVVRTLRFCCGGRRCGGRRCGGRRAAPRPAPGVARRARLRATARCAAVLAILATTAPAARARDGAAGPPAVHDRVRPDSTAHPLLDALDAELRRSWDLLQEQPEPPYWLQLAAVDRRTASVQATHGAAGTWEESHSRIGDVDIRVGSPALDNTHKLRDAGWFADEPRPRLALPIEDDPVAVRTALWRSIDDSYRSAVRQLIKVRTNEAVKVAQEDTSGDFSDAPAVVDVRPGATLDLDGAEWTERVREVSALFLEYPEVFDSNVSFTAEQEVRVLVSSDGTRLRFPRTHLRVAVSASTVAEDGMELEVYDYVDAATPDKLPDDDGLAAMARAVAERVTALRSAPVVDPYVGPAILRGRAAAVFFHEVLGHRVEGHRQKDEDEGQTFTDKVGEPVLPDFISVFDDPTLASWEGVDLNGTYPYDDEGVAAQRVPVVEDGVLRGFLLSRSPIEGFDHSNGHGRRQPGAAPVARQGNLIVEASRTVSYAELRQRLVDELEEQGRPFGLIFDDITGGFTFTGRVTPNAFNVQPVTVWRVYADGRPDELVRGVDMIGTPLTTFERILAASDRTEVFNGVCGAESGWVPVSAIAPDLLIEEVEVQRKEKAQDRPPLLDPPLPEGVRRRPAPQEGT